MTDDEADALAESIAAQTRELWGHVPLAEQPNGGDDADLLVKTDSDGNLMFAWGAVLFMLREGAGWVHRPVPTGQEVSCYRDGRLVQRVVVQDTSLN